MDDGDCVRLGESVPEGELDADGVALALGERLCVPLGVCVGEGD